MPESVSLVMMVRDGVETLERCLESVFDRDVPLVQEAVIVPGGPSKDGTEDLIERLSTRWPLRFEPLPEDVKAAALEDSVLVDYSAVRNYAHSKARGAWQFWLDADDTVPTPERVRQVLRLERDTEVPDGTPSTGLPDFLSTLPPPVSSVWCSYHYHIEPTTDRVLTSYIRERILRWQDGFRWVWPIHEQVSPVPPNRYSKETRYDHPYFWIEHRPTVSEGARLERNFRILERLKPLGQIRWRVAYYLADHYTWANQYDEAAKMFDQAAILAVNDEERYLTWHNAFRLAMRAGWHEHAITAALRAHAYKPAGIEALADLVCIFATMGNAVQAVHWYGFYREAEKGQDSLFAAEAKLLPHLAVAPMLGAMRRYKESAEACRAALRFEPRHPDAKRMLALSERMEARLEAVEHAVALAQHAREIGDPEAAQNVLAALPPAVREMSNVQAERARASAGAVRAYTLSDLRLVDPAPEWVPDGIPCYGFGGNGPPLSKDAPVLALHDVWARIDHPSAILRLGVRKLLLTTPLEDTGREATLRTESARSWIEKLHAQGGLEHLQTLHPGGLEPPHLLAWVRPGVWNTGARIHIYAPAFIEAWGPTSPEAQGSGASEEQIVLLARWLATRGYRVTVFGAVPEPCVDQSVVWLPVSDWTGQEKCDLLIAHRAPWVTSHPIAAEKVWVWLHDQPESFPVAAFMPRLREKVSRYVTLTETMKRGYESVHRIEARETLGYFLPPCDLEPLGPAVEAPRACYLSAPYRGLHHLLALWPEVLTAVPDAMLTIAYGWQVHDAMARLEGAGGLRAMRTTIEALLKQPGVEWLGRLPQGRVREILDASKVWAYPCTFPEMLCSTAVRAMARGAWPVIRPYAALEEVVPDGDLVECDPETPEGRAVYRDRLVAALLRPAEEMESRRCALRDVALRRHAEAIEAWTQALREDGLGHLLERTAKP